MSEDQSIHHLGGVSADTTFYMPATYVCAGLNLTDRHHLAPLHFTIRQVRSTHEIRTHACKLGRRDRNRTDEGDEVGTGG